VSGQLGFRVEFRTPEVDFHDFCARWLDALEPLGLVTGGSGNGRVWSYFVTTSEFSCRRNCIEADREKVLAWLREQEEVTFAKVGPLVGVEQGVTMEECGERKE
jgi:uncharacterized protein YggL (DUF469 family)